MFEPFAYNYGEVLQTKILKYRTPKISKQTPPKNRKCSILYAKLQSLMDITQPSRIFPISQQNTYKMYITAILRIRGFLPQFSDSIFVLKIRRISMD